MSTQPRTGNASIRNLPRRLPLALALACAWLSAPAWAADGMIVFRGAIVAPSCLPQISGGRTPAASVSCPQNGTQAAEFASLPLMPGKTVQLKSARASVETMRFSRGDVPDGAQPGLMLVTEHY
ncbi:hypothetical protein AB4Z48_24840 [Cupriavidus sp. 2TAF22]|uniref:hypothetical protein n=1 Tax=unclassified Cupriavidus TaxID=2640874 RepID=UPI003F8F23E2